MFMQHMTLLMTSMDLERYYVAVRQEAVKRYHHSTLLNWWLSDMLRADVRDGYQITPPAFASDRDVYLPTPHGAIRLTQRKDGRVETSIYDHGFLTWSCRSLNVPPSRFAIQNIYDLRHVYLRSILSLTVPPYKENMKSHTITMMNGSKFTYLWDNESFALIADANFKKGTSVDNLSLDKYFKIACAG